MQCFGRDFFCVHEHLSLFSLSWDIDFIRTKAQKSGENTIGYIRLYLVEGENPM